MNINNATLTVLTTAQNGSTVTGTVGQRPNPGFDPVVAAALAAALGGSGAPTTRGRPAVPSITAVTGAAGGLSAFYLTPADAQRFGLAAVGVSAGALTVSFAPDGSTTAISLNGHLAADVYAALT